MIGGAIIAKALEQGAFEGIKSSSFDMPKFFKSETPSLEIKDFKEADLPLNFENNAKYKENGQTLETDDNGKIYKQNGELIPNVECQVNGYEYKTDGLGRVISADAKELHLSDLDHRKAINETNVGGEDKLDTDDRGHLIADRFGGSNKIENLVAMDSNLNRGEFKKIENDLALAIQDKKEASLQVEPVYEGNSKRPSEFVVTYKIDGEETVTILPNERKDNQV